jgi:hypothetical protein
MKTYRSQWPETCTLCRRKIPAGVAFVWFWWDLGGPQPAHEECARERQHRPQSLREPNGEDAQWGDTSV